MKRQQDVTRVVVVPLKQLQERIPRNAGGDPAFQHLGALEEVPPDAPETLLQVFTPQQIVSMVNRYLYQAEYQQKVHRDRAERIRNEEKPVKEAAKRLFPGVSFINLTDEQIREAVNEAFGRKER